MQDGVDSPFREIERAAASLLQLFDHGIAVRGAVTKSGEDQGIEVTL
jgi:hypothetical protein